jgi:hypothetical protein
MQAKQRVSPPRRNQLTGSTVCYARGARFIVAQAARMGHRGSTTGGNPGNVRSNRKDAFWTTVATMPRRCGAARARNHE